MSFCFHLLTLSILASTTPPSPPAASKLKNQPPRSWTRWVEKYASPNALLALNKAIPPAFQITKEHLDNILLLKTKVEFKEKVQIGTRDAKDVDLATLSEGAHFSEGTYADHMLFDGMNPELALQYSTRNRRIVEESEKLILNRQSDELVIIDVGALHAVDLFLSSFLKDETDPYRSRLNQIQYFSCSRDKKVPLNTPEYHQHRKMYTGLDSPKKKVEDANGHAPIATMARILLFRRWSADRFTSKNLLSAGETVPGVLVLLDFHGLRDTSCIRDLPEPQDLQKLGFKRITIGTEVFKAGKEVSDQEYEKDFRIFPENLDLEGFESSQKKTVTDFVAENRVIRLPIQEKLFEKIKLYRKAGIPTKILGLEPLDPEEVKQRTKFQ